MNENGPGGVAGQNVGGQESKFEDEKPEAARNPISELIEDLSPPATAAKPQRSNQQKTVDIRLKSMYNINQKLNIFQNQDILKKTKPDRKQMKSRSNSKFK